MLVLGEGGEKDFGSFLALKEDLGADSVPQPLAFLVGVEGLLVHAYSPGVFCLASTPPLAVLDSTELGPLKGTNGHICVF